LLKPLSLFKLPIQFILRFFKFDSTLSLKKLLPAAAFFGGFLWDALTIGRQINPLDLWILTGYLFAAGLILFWMGHKSHFNPLATEAEGINCKLSSDWQRNAPTFILQFLFGSLFSCLFILYFKSANHLLALFWSLSLGLLLVANEYIDHHYNRFTLTWALFGLCTILVFNFILPFVLGSVYAIWFYLSTFVGALLTHYLRKKTPGCPGRAWPVWVIAGTLTVAYLLDFIPPVPLVKRDIQIGLELKKQNGDMQLMQEDKPWYKPWRLLSNDLHVPAGQPVYCVSAVFAPEGISTTLYHRWELFDEKQGWETKSRIGFNLSGGRNGGFRGYTYKRNIQPGEWRIKVETENKRTLTVYQFTLYNGSDSDPDFVAKTIK
jgi:hypothetical protein